MWFWWIMLVCSHVVPAITILAGWFMWKHAPEKINKVIGYRTKRSMQNEDTWEFAHKFCGKLWWIMGWIVFALSAVVLIPFCKSSYNTIGIVAGVIVGVQCVLLVMSYIPTEIALKKKFFDDGTLR